MGKMFDYHLIAGSPGINFGDPANQPSNSLGSISPDGFILNDGPARDAEHHSAGAYEFQGEIPPQLCTETQLLNYISQCKTGAINMTALMQKIAAWKAGMEC